MHARVIILGLASLTLVVASTVRLISDEGNHGDTAYTIATFTEQPAQAHLARYCSQGAATAECRHELSVIGSQPQIDLRQESEDGEVYHQFILVTPERLDELHIGQVLDVEMQEVLQAQRDPWRVTEVGHEAIDRAEAWIRSNPETIEVDSFTMIEGLKHHDIAQSEEMRENLVDGDYPDL